MDSASVSATPVSTRPPTDHASPVLHAHLPAQETLKENASVTPDLPNTEITAPSAHWEPFSTTPPKNASMSADKTQPMMPTKRSVFASMDMVFTEAFAPSVPPTSSSKTTTVSPVHSTQPTTQSPRSVLVMQVIFWTEIWSAPKNVETMKSTTLRPPTVTASQVSEESMESVESAQPVPFQAPMELVDHAPSTKSSSMVNASAQPDSSPMNLRSVPDAVKFLVLS